MFIFICFLGGGRFRGPVGVLATGVPQCARCRVPLGGRLEKRTCYQGRALEREGRDI